MSPEIYIPNQFFEEIFDSLAKNSQGKLDLVSAQADMSNAQLSKVGHFIKYLGIRVGRDKEEYIRLVRDEGINMGLHLLVEEILVPLREEVDIQKTCELATKQIKEICLGV